MPGYARNPDAIADDVLVFPDAATRAISLPSPMPSQITYLEDTKLVQFWDGSQWVDVAAQPTDLSDYATKNSPDFTGIPSAPTALIGTKTTQIATTEFVNSIEQIMIIALSDEITAITTGNAKVTFRAPFAMSLTQIPRASLSIASSSGIPTIDINDNGSSILSTKITIDVNEKTSTTASIPAVLSDTSISDDAEITFDVDVAGTGAKGLKVVLYYRRS